MQTKQSPFIQSLLAAAKANKGDEVLLTVHIPSGIIKVDHRNELYWKLR